VQYRYPETVSLISRCQSEYEAEMKRRGKRIPVHTDWEDGLPEEFKGKSQLPMAPAEEQHVAKPHKEGVLRTTSKAEIAREIMRKTKDSGMPLDAVVQMIMEATGHDKALAKATYKANAARVGITL